MRFYYATSKDKVGRILREGLNPSSKRPIRIADSLELVMFPGGIPIKGDVVVLELRGLNRQSVRSKTDKEKYQEGESLILSKSVPADKIRIYSGLGYSQVIDLSGPVTRRIWIDVGNNPKEKNK